MNTPKITRRRSIAIAGTTIAAGVGLALGTEEAGAQADINLGEIDMNGNEFSPADGQLWAVYAQIQGQFEYRVDADPDVWEAYLLVYDQGGNSEAIAVTDGDATARQDSGTFAIQGDIMASSFYAPEDFAVPDGESSVTVDVPVEIAFLVRDASDTMLVQARAADSAPVTVSADGTVAAAVGGTGGFAAVDDSDDPTPTPPGGA